MTWLIAALVSSFMFAVASVLDKRLLDRLFPSFASFNVVFGLLQFPVGAVFFVAIVPFVGVDGGSGIAWATASGLLWAVGLSLFFYVLRSEEVSRAAPIQSMAPVFAAVIAVSLLGEELNMAQWIAIIVVVVGAGMISLRPEGGRVRIANRRALALLVLSSFALGLAFVVSKEATDRMNIWAIQAFRSVAMGMGALALSWRPAVNHELALVFRRGRTMGLMFITEGVLSPLAALIFIVALTLGPVSVVSAVTSARPLAVLIISSTLSTQAWNVLNEPLDRQTLTLKAASTALIVGGVVALGII